jgi:hypothetical protein
MKKKRILYKIESLHTSGWADAGWTEDDKPLRFPSVLLALKAIRDLVKENKNENSKHYRVVPVA